MVDAILDEIDENEKHPLAELAEAISVFTEKYETEHAPISMPKVPDILRYLMQEHDLRQSDLPEEVLAGKRDLNTRQIRRLTKRLSVSAAVFV